MRYLKLMSLARAVNKEVVMPTHTTCLNDRTSKCPGIHEGCWNACECYRPMNVLDKERMARKTDPMSSHMAAADMLEAGQRQKQHIECLYALRENPMSTSRELADLLGVDRYRFSRRLPELEREGMVERVRQPDGSFFMRKCNVGGKMSCIWIAKIV